MAKHWHPSSPIPTPLKKQTQLFGCICQDMFVSEQILCHTEELESLLWLILWKENGERCRLSWEIKHQFLVSLNPFKEKAYFSSLLSTVLPFFKNLSCCHNPVIDRHLITTTYAVVTWCDVHKTLLKKWFPAGGNTVQCLKPATTY